jgi:hypothetical protein
VVQRADKGPEILETQNFRGPEIPEFPGAGNSRISGPRDFSLSPLSQVVVQLSGEGRNFWPEIPFWNFRGAGISAPRPEFPPLVNPGISAPRPEFPG